MCSSVVQTVLCLVLVIGTGLAVASLLTPAWRNYSLKEARDSLEHGDFSLGLITSLCGESRDCAEAFDVSFGNKN